MRRKWERGDVRRQDIIRQSRRRKSDSLIKKSRIIFFFFFWRSSEISAGASWCGFARKLMFLASLQTWIWDYEISVVCYSTFQKPTQHYKLNIVEKPRQRPSLFIDSLGLFLQLVWCYLLRADSLLIAHLCVCFALGFKNSTWLKSVTYTNTNLLWPQGQIDEFIYSGSWSILTVVNRIN